LGFKGLSFIILITLSEQRYFNMYSLLVVIDCGLILFTRAWRAYQVYQTIPYNSIKSKSSQAG